MEVYVRNKKFVLSVLDNVLLKETEQYFAEGNAAEGGSVQQAVKAIKIRRGLSQDHLQLAAPLLEEEKCPLCRWAGKEWKGHGKEELRSHLKACHGPFQGEIPTEEANEAISKCNEFFLGYRKDQWAEIEYNYRDSFSRRKDDISNKGRIEGNCLPRFECFKCNTVFGTTHEAMARHAEAHTNNDYIFNGRFDVTEDNPNHGLSNPSTHRFDPQHDHYTFSTQAKLHSVTAPDGALSAEGSIKCRRCGDFTLAFSGLLAKEQMKAAKKMGKHEKGCKKKKGNTVSKG